MKWASLSQAELHAVMVFLAVRGVGKIKDFARFGPPSSRQSPEDILLFAIKNLEQHLPSITSLDEDGLHCVESTFEILKQFNLGQYLQGENNPHSISLLKNEIDSEGLAALKVYLFAQVCTLSGLTGSATLKGSLFLNEQNTRSLIQGVRCLQKVMDEDAVNVYWRFVASRATSVQAGTSQPAELALARLLCLTRSYDMKGLEEVKKAWNAITARERSVLEECLLCDGMASPSYLLAFLPQFLANARANHHLGLAAPFKWHIPQGCFKVV